MTTEELAISTAKEFWGNFGVWILPLGIIATAFLFRLNSGSSKDIEIPIIRKYWKIILIGIIGLALGIRVVNISYTGLHIDESNHYLMARNISDNGKWSYRSGARDLTSIDLTAEIAILHRILGDEHIELAARLPSAVFSSLTIIPLALLVYTITQSPTAALIAAVLWAIDPFAVFWGRYARFYSFYAFWSFLALASIPKLLKSKSSSWIWIFMVSIIGTLFARGWPILILIPPLFTHLVRIRKFTYWRYFLLATAIIGVFALSISSLSTSRDVAISSSAAVESSLIGRTTSYFKLFLSSIFSENNTVGACSSRFFWNDLSAIPLFVFIGILGFMTTAIFHRKSVQAWYLVLFSTLLTTAIFLLATKCQIRWQWPIHILWIAFTAIFASFLLRSFYTPKRPLANTVLLIIVLTILVKFVVNIQTTKTILHLRPGDPAPYYFYFTNSRSWVEDSRSVGVFVKNHASSTDLITTSMWQHFSYFWNLRNQFQGVILLSSKPVDSSAYVTGGTMYWSDLQIKELIQQATTEKRGIWFIYDRAKTLSDYVTSTIAQEKNIQFIGDDGRTTVYYYKPITAE